MEIEIYQMTYKNENSLNDIRILGEEFVRNNGNKGILIINNKKMKFPKKGVISLKNIAKNKIKMILKKTFLIKALCSKIVNH